MSLYIVEILLRHYWLEKHCRSFYNTLKTSIVENVGELKDEENARDSIARRILVRTSQGLCRAVILGKLYRGEETRYDVQIIHTYRNRFRLEHREFLWVPNLCDCPDLQVGRQYILMVRRHINYEHTLNRILLEEESYVVPYRPREDELLRPLERLCSNRGPKLSTEIGDRV
ncbi:hypothetical protein XENOCAPTIV_019671 [Xenoophorus captivus]|uniref:Netrin module non-TIMP type domain-containing protein n=1 Tax=Xenoophorus captivus TaxID=1517983 RepID=A0ABV0S7U2_9TELE